MIKIRVAANAMSVRTKRLGCGGVKIMAIPYKKDKGLCSPTSALEKKRINVEREELRNPS